MFGGGGVVDYALSLTEAYSEGDIKVRSPLADIL